MKYYDISAPFGENLPFYPSDPPLKQEEHAQVRLGSAANVSKITFGSHTGTHLDPPRHFFDELPAVDELPLERFLGPALVAEILGKPCVERADLEVLPLRPGLNLLLKTDNRELMADARFHPDYVYLTGDACALLVEKKVNLVGVDYLSVEQFQGDGTFPAHRTLLGNNVLVLEGLDLSQVPAGEYTLLALPLKIPGGNGSPVRAVLIAQEEGLH